MFIIEGIAFKGEIEELEGGYSQATTVAGNKRILASTPDGGVTLVTNKVVGSVTTDPDHFLYGKIVEKVYSDGSTEWDQPESGGIAISFRYLPWLEHAENPGGKTHYIHLSFKHS